MPAVTNDFIRQILQDSKRGDGFFFTDEEILLKAEAARLIQLPQVQSEMVPADPIEATAINPAHNA
jgi:hypothetical protein